MELMKAAGVFGCFDQISLWAWGGARAQEVGVFDASSRKRSRWATAIQEAGHAVVALAGLNVPEVRLESDEEGIEPTLNHVPSIAKQ